MNERKIPISSAVSDEESALNRLGIKTYHWETIQTGIFLEREERVGDIFIFHGKTGVASNWNRKYQAKDFEKVYVLACVAGGIVWVRD